MTLRQKVSVRRRFQRSIRLDTDLNDANALHGFICPATYKNALNTLAEHASQTGHGAYTWTGPFGGGKSSLAVVLAALLNPPGKLRTAALEITGECGKHLVGALRPGRYGYRSVAVVGRKQEITEQIVHALRREGLIRKGIDTKSDGGHALLETLKSIVARPKHRGLLIILDELGKVLEAAATGKADLHFLQELAELASRSDGKLIVVGILHQAFGEYTGKLAQRTRNEWMKVQGRFIDVPLSTVADEQIALLSEAIESSPTKAAETKCKEVAAVLAESRSVSGRAFTQQITGCWPLNGITAALLGPFSRRRFGQNQRSIFSFLNSAEPLGFQAFIELAKNDQTYNPSMFWDYLRANLEPSILASPDSHRWSTALESLLRCETKGGSPDHLKIVKCIAIIDLFKEQSGIQASKKLLKFAAPDIAPRQQTKILRDLESWSVIAFRRHLQAYSVHAGSDFEIEQAIAEERDVGAQLDLEAVQQLAELRPMIAKRHYHKTGALRWVDVDIAYVDELPDVVDNLSPPDGSIGTFVAAIPSVELSKPKTLALLKRVSESAFPTVTVGLLPDSEEIIDLAEELVALERIQNNRPELSGDAVARREVAAHRDATRQALSTKLHEAMLNIEWFSGGTKQRLSGIASVHAFVSDLADKVFPESPILPNELLNRSKPSSTAVAARRVLLHSMVANRGEPRLGIQGFPAEGGLFESLLGTTGIYREQTEISPNPAFYTPAPSDSARLHELWKAADALVDSSVNTPIALTEIYSAWREPPYGVKEGLLPVLALSYVLSRTDRLAIYLDGAFRPEVDDFVVDRMQQEPQVLRLRKMDFGKLRSNVLEGIADIVAAYDDAEIDPKDPLVVARRLVGLVTALPAWTLRTNTLSLDAQRLRSIVKSASDPHRFLFDDLPGFAADGADQLEEKDIKRIVDSIRRGLEELVRAYDVMLEKMTSLLLEELGSPLNGKGLKTLRDRAQNIQGLTGDFRLDAFAARLVTISKRKDVIEGIASLAANKPPRDWIDRDLDAARIEIADLARRFTRSEAFGRVKGRPDTRHAMAFVIGMQGSAETIVEEFEVDDEGLKLANKLAEEIEEKLIRKDLPRSVLLATFAQAGARLSELQEPAEKSRSNLKKVS